MQRSGYEYVCGMPSLHGGYFRPNRSARHTFRRPVSVTQYVCHWFCAS